MVHVNDYWHTTLHGTILMARSGDSLSLPPTGQCPTSSSVSRNRHRWMDGPTFPPPSSAKLMGNISSLGKTVAIDYIWWDSGWSDSSGRCWPSGIKQPNTVILWRSMVSVSVTVMSEVVERHQCLQGLKFIQDECSSMALHDMPFRIMNVKGF